MSMSKKDYELIARTIAEQVAAIETKREALIDEPIATSEEFVNRTARLTGERDALAKLVFTLAERFERENPKFNPTVFICRSGIK